MNVGVEFEAEYKQDNGSVLRPNLTLAYERGLGDLNTISSSVCALSNDLEHGACLVIGGSGSLFDVKPLGVDVASDGSGLSVF